MRTIAQKYYISWLIFFTISVVIFLSSCDNNIFDNKPFNQKAWIENPFNKDSNVRIEMSEDLLKNHLKIGMTRQQVRKLLGKPDSVDSYSGGSSNYDNYYLGEYTFLLRFDRASKLVDKEIVSI
ncbi:MAG: outer membrane protein assembly factor BamE [Aphanothece sp. CMT-3BRIN-NPC111]|jgi:outer membrane protein assembly factor BamE (lipoprotein component of BamABCDE complex)|nr:outer membrane protein assembly factor BamE [Aphanothece sp. CMT-3BRIN-NPC111]